MNRNVFRKELIKIMPGYKWTVHRSTMPERIIFATGTVSVGLNRMSTLHITKQRINDSFEYQATSSGFGSRSPWLAERSDKTLARALRALQDHYELVAQNYSRHAADLQNGRKVSG